MGQGCDCAQALVFFFFGLHRPHSSSALLRASEWFNMSVCVYQPSGRDRETCSSGRAACQMARTVDSQQQQDKKCDDYGVLAYAVHGRADERLLLVAHDVVCAGYW